MKITPTIAREKLNSAITDISDVGWMYSSDPDSDFTRDRKLPMKYLLQMLLKFSGKSLQSEISAFYPPPEKIYRHIPTKSAFSQQRRNDTEMQNDKKHGRLRTAKM